jgi:hypothetical protein
LIGARRSIYRIIWARIHKGEIKVKLNVMFVIAAVLLVLIGLASFLAPASLVGANPSAAFNAKITGVIAFSFGVMAWLVRNAEPSKTRNSIVVAFILMFALWAVVSLYGVCLTDMPTHSISWIPALIQALLAIGFFVTGRPGMSKGGS